MTQLYTEFSCDTIKCNNPDPEYCQNNCCNIGRVCEKINRIFPDMLCNIKSFTIETLDNALKRCVTEIESYLSQSDILFQLINYTFNQLKIFYESDEVKKIMIDINKDYKDPNIILITTMRINCVRYCIKNVFNFKYIYDDKLNIEIISEKLGEYFDLLCDQDITHCFEENNNCYKKYYEPSMNNITHYEFIFYNIKNVINEQIIDRYAKKQLGILFFSEMCRIQIKSKNKLMNDIRLIKKKI
jgi:hypothetical protein